MICSFERYTSHRNCVCLTRGNVLTHSITVPVYTTERSPGGSTSCIGMQKSLNRAIFTSDLILRSKFQGLRRSSYNWLGIERRYCNELQVQKAGRLHMENFSCIKRLNCLYIQYVYFNVCEKVHPQYST